MSAEDKAKQLYPNHYTDYEEGILYRAFLKGANFGFSLLQSEIKDLLHVLESVQEKFKSGSAVAALKAMDEIKQALGKYYEI